MKLLDAAPVIIALAITALGDQAIRSVEFGPGGRPDIRSADTAPDPTDELEQRLIDCLDESHPIELYGNLHPPQGVDDGRVRHGIGRAITITGSAIDRENDGKWDGRDSLDWFLDNKVPEDFSGPLVLDWEGQLMRHLDTGTQDQADAAIDQMIVVADYVKSRRPNAQVSYYSVPTRRYWKQSDEWRKRNLYIGERLRPHVDAFMISAYDFYEVNEARDHRVNQAMVKLAMEMAAGEVKVGAFTWHRRHVSHKTQAMSLIPEAEYIAHTRALTQVRHEYRRIDQIIAWGATSYYFNNRDGLTRGVTEAKAAELRPDESIPDYIARLHPVIYRRMREAVPDAAIFNN